MEADEKVKNRRKHSVAGRKKRIKGDRENQLGRKASTADRSRG